MSALMNRPVFIQLPPAQLTITPDIGRLLVRYEYDPPILFVLDTFVVLRFRAR